MNGTAPFPSNLQIRLATMADVPALAHLIELSVRCLQVQDYSPAQIELALRKVYGVDTQLIADGTYFAVEAFTRNESHPALAGCGGWSKRKTLYGGDVWAHREDDLLDPSREAAKIRAFFVHPEWARRGIGTIILDSCESAARAAGFSRLEMGATLTGVPFYHRKGYSEIERVDAPLSEGVSLSIVRMAKAI